LRTQMELRDRLELMHRRAMFQRLTDIERNRYGWPNLIPPISLPVPCDLDEQFARLRDAAPRNFGVWLTASEAGRIAYEKRDAASLSTVDHRDAFRFRQFLAIHARGRILDIGVGPLAIPSYLVDFHPARLAAIDPLLPYEEHPFAFVRSTAEFIPWSDESFETVVAATSLDHLYLLDRALGEIRRVLIRGGRFIVWSAVFPHTPPYDPCGETITPPDAYHLFHPGENWFPALLSRYFRLIERIGDEPSAMLNASFFAFE
jgi:SAM-dependent methyltransferase